MLSIDQKEISSRLCTSFLLCDPFSADGSFLQMQMIFCRHFPLDDDEG